MKKLLLLLFCFVCGASAAIEAADGYQAVPGEKWSKEKWSAFWIACPDASLYDYGVYHFRKKFTVAAKPDSFIINVSADNRYRLFVNGVPVCWGPARGDLNHWYFETVDIAPLLDAGENVLAVAVWNFGEYAPGAQMTLKTGLIVQGNSPDEEIVNTNPSWKVCQDKAYSPMAENMQDVGCGDVVKGSLYPWGWEALPFDDSSWLMPRVLGWGRPYGTGTGYDWMLLKRDIPLMEEVRQNMGTVRRSDNVVVPDGFLDGKSPLTIAANQKVSFLIDQAFLTTAYPEINLSGGGGGSVKLTYSEALYKDGQKSNRNEIEGRAIRGYSDIFYPDGENGRQYRTLWFRTYRYIQVDIETADEPLVINSMYGMYTGYPFRENGSFECNDPGIKDLWDVGWRTARLCAHETYMSCS